MTVGLLVPDRVPTPCDGRAQYYKRPGVPEKQKTRTFQNGTTLTFGPEDPVDEFKPGDAFFEQTLVIESATADIKAVHEQYRKVQGAHLGLDMDKLSLLDASIAERFPGHLRSSSAESGISNPATQIGLEDTSLKFPTEKVTSVFDSDHQNPPKLSTANVYQSINHSSIPGMGHPGFSTDTRGGGAGFPGGPPGSRAPRAPAPNRIAGKNFESVDAVWANPTEASADYHSRQRQQSIGHDLAAQQNVTRDRGRSRVRRVRGEKNSSMRTPQRGPNDTQQHARYHTLPLGLPSVLRSTLPPAYPPAPYRAAISEYYRWNMIKEQLIVLPQASTDAGLPAAYIIDPPEPLHHPNIIEVHGPRESWERMLRANINHSNNGKRSQELENILNNIIYGPNSQGSVVGLPRNQSFAIGEGVGGGARFHTRDKSDASSVWYKDTCDESTSNTRTRTFPGNAMSGDRSRYSTQGDVHDAMFRSEATPNPQAQVVRPNLQNFIDRGHSTVGPAREATAAAIQRIRSFRNGSQHTRSQYLGYSIAGEEMNPPSIEASPSPHRRLADALHLHGLESRQSSPGFVNMGRAHSQIFAPPTRPSSAAEYCSSGWEGRL